MIKATKKDKRTITTNELLLLYKIMIKSTGIVLLKGIKQLIFKGKSKFYFRKKINC